MSFYPKMWASLISIVSFFCPLAYADDPGLAKVVTTYIDRVTGKTDTLIGTGPLLQLNASPPRFFVLTTTHLTQGEKGFSLTLPNGKLATVKDGGTAHLSDNKNDVGLIEIEDPKTAPLGYVTNCLGATVTINYHAARSSQGLCVTVLDSRAWSSKSISVGGPGELATVLKPSWTNNPGVVQGFNLNAVQSTAMGGGGYRNHYVSEIKYGGELSMRSKIQGGMSGVPLLTPQLDPTTGKMSSRLAGMMREYDRFYLSSQASSEKMIRDVINDFMQGKRDGQANLEKKYRTQIYRRNGLSIRDYGDGTLSVNTQKLFAGGDGGNVSDGGGGNVSDGGGGLTSITSDPTAVYAAHSIAPGLTYKGKPVIGFQLKTGEVFFANPNALDYLDMNPSNTINPVKPIPAGSNLIALLKAKLGTKMENFELDHNQYLYEQVRMYAKHLNGKTRLVFYFSWPQKDTVVVFLDEKGNLLDDKGRIIAPFTPVMRIKGKNTKKDYLLDLRRFYFTDLSAVPTREEINKPFPDPMISIRRSDAGTEFELNFEKVKPIESNTGFDGVIEGEAAR